MGWGGYTSLVNQTAVYCAVSALHAYANVYSDRQTNTVDGALLLGVGSLTCEVTALAGKSVVRFTLGNRVVVGLCRCVCFGGCLQHCGFALRSLMLFDVVSLLLLYLSPT